MVNDGQQWLMMMNDYHNWGWKRTGEKENIQTQGLVIVDIGWKTLVLMEFHSNLWTYDSWLGSRSVLSKSSTIASITNQAGFTITTIIWYVIFIKSTKMSTSSFWKAMDTPAFSVSGPVVVNLLEWFWWLPIFSHYLWGFTMRMV